MRPDLDALGRDPALITRPSGRRYRPRKPPAGSYLDDGDGNHGVVLIWRTHDVAAHQTWAERLWRQGVDSASPVSLLGTACWVRLVPWDTSGHGGDSTWVTCHGDDPRACPAVEYRPEVSG